jgi:glycosyltransferase involved in cell wall biosynthesis
MNLELPKISAVMCTYRRFKCVERAVNFFLQQTYPNKELILYNTDIEHPYKNQLNLQKKGITIINENVDEITKLPYTNVGAIRRDALTYANGDYVVTWDDDDVWMDFFMQQSMDRMHETKLPSIKPEKSFFYSGNNLRLVMNTLEASVVAKIDKVRKYGYLLETGKEGLAWYTAMRDNKELDEHDRYYIPAYCFNWQDGQEMNAQHKQSGDIDNPLNFSNHKENSTDAVFDREIEIFSREHVVDVLLHDYYEFLYRNTDIYPAELVEKYLYP